MIILCMGLVLNSIPFLKVANDSYIEIVKMCDGNILPSDLR